MGLPTRRSEWQQQEEELTDKALAELIKQAQREAIEETNRRFAITEIGSDVRKPVIAELNGAGDLVCYRLVPDFKQSGVLNPHSSVPYLVKKEGLAGTALKFMSAEQLWLSDDDRRHYQRMVLAPPGSQEVLDEHDYNLWRGFAVQPKRGKWTLIQRHLKEVICNGDSKLYEWLLNWVAALLQRPGQHGMTALVLRGGQGIGKGTLAYDILGKMFRPRQYVTLDKPAQVTSDFNSQLSDRCLVFADEAFWKDKKAANMLKGLITGDTLLINPKHLPIRSEPSCLHIIIASNAERPVAIERDDRRFVVFEVAETYKQQPSYFKPLYAEMNSGGREAFLHDMLNRKIGEDALRNPPHTVVKGEMKEASLEPMDEWWQEQLSESDGATWQTRRTRQALHHDLADWWNKRKQSGAVPSIQQLGNFLAKHFKRGGSPSWPRTTKIDKSNAWVFPPLAECRAVFERTAGFTPEWAPLGDAEEEDSAA